MTTEILNRAELTEGCVLLLVANHDGVHFNLVLRDEEVGETVGVTIYPTREAADANFAKLYAETMKYA